MSDQWQVGDQIELVPERRYDRVKRYDKRWGRRCVGGRIEAVRPDGLRIVNEDDRLVGLVRPADQRFYRLVGAAVQPEPERPQRIRLVRRVNSRAVGSEHDVMRWDGHNPVIESDNVYGYVPIWDGEWEPADAPVDEPEQAACDHWSGWHDEGAPMLCSLPEGHDGQHAGEGIEWTDEEAAALIERSRIAVPAPPVEPWKEGDWFTIGAAYIDITSGKPYRVEDVGTNGVSFDDDSGALRWFPVGWVTRCDPPVVDEPAAAEPLRAPVAAAIQKVMGIGVPDDFSEHWYPEEFEAADAVLAVLAAAAPSDPEMVAVMLPREFVERWEKGGNYVMDDAVLLVGACQAAALRQGQNQQDAAAADQQEGNGR